MYSAREAILVEPRERRRATMQIVETQVMPTRRPRVQGPRREAISPGMRPCGRSDDGCEKDQQEGEWRVRYHGALLVSEAERDCGD